ncbi:hypothetical protein IJI94_03170 [Candidatus Saccharibacteria bacterium]|nr:hypothetical protein [Candidatus Saccharibacteria bacterium]
MPKNLELPLGKRTRLYRFLEILPGFLSYTLLILLFVLSFVKPIIGAIYLILVISITLVKAIAVAFRTIQGYGIVKKASMVDWRNRLKDLEDPHAAYEKLKDESSESYGYKEHIENTKRLSIAEKGKFLSPKEVYHAVIMVAYNEGLDTLIPSVEAVKNTGFPNDQIIFVLGYEERGGEEMEKNAKELKKRYEGVFAKFLLVKHPENLRGEIIGKGPNLTYAGEKLAEYVEKHHIKKENVIVTSLDSDNRMSEKYLDYVAYEFIVHEERQHLSYQPVSLFMNNIWDVPAPMRIIGISNSFFNIITTMRPHALRNFASHSQPLAALIDMKFWSKRTIVEDGHQYWRSLFHFDGDYEVLPIRVPIYQDAVMEETLWATIKAQFIQLRRWDYGASDVAYVGARLFSEDRKIPFAELFTKFWRLLDGHVTLAIMSPMVMFGGWVPMILNLSSRSIVAFNLPKIVGIVQTIASIGLFITILTSIRMLPKRPAKYRKHKSILMVLQWILMPLVALLYQSLAAFYAQTRLMTGHYMEKFDVTKKVVKK